MKMTTFTPCHCGIVLAVLVGISAPGCRNSGWTMPGGKMFASREPDAATLAGKSGVPQLPESPASKYSPDNIAAVGQNSTAPASPRTAETPAMATAGSSYGYPAQTVAAPSQSGLAAKANGYQTGPYELGSGGATAPSPSAGLPSPYGGSFGESGSLAAGVPSNATPDIALPNSVTNAMGNAMPNCPACPGETTAADASNLPAPGGYPPPPASGSFAAGTAGTNTSPHLFAGHSTTPQPNAGQDSGSPGSSTVIPGGTTSTQGAGESTVAPSAYQGTTAAGGYAPGTTGRATGYDFSGGTTSAAAPPTRPSYSLPPNTATAPSQGMLR